MEAVRRTLEREDRLNHRVASVVSLFVERFRQTTSGADLQEALDFIRLGLLTNQDLVRAERVRAKRRGPLISSRVSRNQQLGPSVEEHYEALRIRMGLLERRAQILRQGADGLAWIVLHRHQGSLRYLFETQTHGVTSGLGAQGPAELIRVANESGRFHAIETDLTRCLGSGDVVVVSLQEPFHPPIAIEVKSRREEPGYIGIELFFNQLEDERARRVSEDLQALLGDRSTPEEVIKEPPTPQLNRFFNKNRQYFDRLRGEPRGFSTDDDHIHLLSLVLERARATGRAFDLAESGMIIGAVRNDSDDRWRRDVDWMKERARDLLGASKESPLLMASSLELLERPDEIAALAAPIAAWRLGVTLRADLLHHDLYLFSFVHIDTLRSKLAELGISLSVVEGEATFSRSDSSITFQAFDWTRLRYDLAFGLGGISGVVAEVDRKLVLYVDEGSDSGVE